MMEPTGRVPGEDERAEEGEGTEGLSLGFGYAASSHLCHQPHKLIRRDASPFWTVSRSPATDAAAASNGRARPPPSPQTLESPPHSGIVGGGGAGTVVFSHSGVSGSYGTPRTTLQPFGTPFSPPGLGGVSTLQLCSPFTAAQWQELHRQALIFKYFMASTPVPPELLFSTRPLPDVHSLISNLGRGGDYLNLRCTGTNGDAEPGRCRRTDGKKWRCSREVAPGQKYCERHMHRARPRSRKPVELDVRAGAAAVADGAAAVLTNSAGMNHATPTTTTSSSSAVARPCAQSSPGVLPGGPDLKFPFQFMVPQGKKLRYLGSGGGDAEPQVATQQWQLLHSKMGPRNVTSGLQQQHEDDQLKLNCTSLNDHHSCPFPSTDVSSLVEDFAEPPDRRDTPRRFIDAWSRDNPFHGVTICDNRDNHRTNKSGSTSLGNLPPSNLTLSMSGTCGGEDQDQFQMGLGPTDSGKMLAPSWICPVSPIGGPLAEVLQTSSTVSLRNERVGRENDVTSGSAGLIDLMSVTSCDSEGTSPRNSTRRGFSSSSPTRVLQMTLVSLSDSSSNSSPTFGPGPRPELALQWASPSN